MARLLFVVTEDWYFVSHRLHLAAAARAAGFEVAVATRVARHGREIEAAGVELLPLARMERGGVHPAREWASVRELAGLYRAWRPEIVHHVAMKPILHGSLAARMAGVPRVVQAVAGMGSLFLASSRRARWLGGPVRWGIGRALAWERARVIVQNGDDLEVGSGCGAFAYRKVE